MVAEIKVSGTDRMLVVDDKVAEEAQKLRWRWDGREVVALKDGLVVRPEVLYGMKRAMLADDDPFNGTRQNLGWAGGRKSRSGVKGVFWAETHKRWVADGRTFETLQGAIAWKFAG